MSLRSNAQPDKSSPADQSRVNLRSPGDVQFWCGHLGCSAAQLRAAVAAVGESTSAVERFIRR